MNIEEIRKGAPSGADYYVITIHGVVIYGEIRNNDELWCYYPDENKWKFPVAQNTIKSMLKPLYP